ncbi:peptide chain release factor N(5)-glutamine methyltransferase [Flavobacterium sp. TAB 87]|uniref:peptide chain release factor N(5)-glutamine methyltransferase n=1 Tax=Flavobacterium sp. TAB 87 TaxID=1729581 RepID=UPI00076C9F1D|nr:peptide chain release factor N(5)-glutamine methyltransferase [Flavobacterium sp. TAB 87]KVV15598.1 Release factor glutamine methyltransferase [Flavobacterium sp. TAB 87]
MRIKSYRTHFIQELLALYDALESESFFYLILEEKHQLKQIHLALNPELEFNVDEIQVWNSFLAQLKKEIPIQYLLGKTSFYGLDFEVNSNVLIPRPETEELVQWIVDVVKFKFPENKKVNILDIGTGSGCIAISLAKNLPNAKVCAIDVSREALETARKNAKNNGVKVHFLHKNILETNELQEQYDIIVSNPPYVRNLEKQEIKNNVLHNEPHLALFVEDEDALIFYKKIADLAQQNLAADGKLFFEINQYLGQETKALLETKSFKNIELRKDIYENDRMIGCEVLKA